MLDDNTTKSGGVALEGGLGQFAIGTFTADAASQLITFSPVPGTGPDSFALINAFQLRAVPTVPEQATVLAALLPLGVCLVGLVSRRR